MAFPGPAPRPTGRSPPRPGPGPAPGLPRFFSKDKKMLKKTPQLRSFAFSPRFIAGAIGIAAARAGTVTPLPLGFLLPVQLLQDFVSLQ